MDDLDLGSSADLTGDKRNVLYDKGLCFARDGKTKSALRCYLHCLSGLDNTNEFTCLPLCLRNVSVFCGNLFVENGIIVMLIIDRYVSM